VKRLSPGPDTVLNEGATLILAGDRRTLERLKHLLVHGRTE
jgi:K+/H+ antiporter YhaU regulatory subunit KhtT